MKKKVKLNKVDKYIKEFRNKSREWKDHYNTKRSPYDIITISDRDNTDKVWMNPNNQGHVNANWLDFSDLDDWLNDVYNEKIFKSKAHMEELYFLCKIPEWMWLKYVYQTWTGIEAKSFNYHSHHRYIENLEMDNTLSENTYKQILSFVKYNYKRDLQYNIFIQSDGIVDINGLERHRQNADKESWGILHLSAMLGMGEYQYSNTPCEIENIAWVRDQLFYEALFEFYRESGVISEEDEIKFFKNGTKWY